MYIPTDYKKCDRWSDIQWEFNSYTHFVKKATSDRLINLASILSILNLASILGRLSDYL